MKQAIEETVAKFGKLAGVINCGGVATAARVSDNMYGNPLVCSSAITSIGRLQELEVNLRAL